MGKADARERRRLALTREEYQELCKSSRLSLPPVVRIPVAAMAAFGLGMSFGLANGAKMTGLRFRAEHAHRLPTTTTGWYMYHRSKNYNAMLGGLKEGFKHGGKLSVMSVAMFFAENLFDTYRGSKDLFNTVAATLAVAGGYSLINRFSAAEAARTAKAGLVVGVLYGGAQDLLSLVKGRPVGYVEFVRRHFGGSTKQQEQHSI